MVLSTWILNTYFIYWSVNRVYVWRVVSLTSVLISIWRRRVHWFINMRVSTATDIISLKCARYCAYYQLYNNAITRGYNGHIIPFHQGIYRFFFFLVLCMYYMLLNGIILRFSFATRNSLFYHDNGVWSLPYWIQIMRCFLLFYQVVFVSTDDEVTVSCIYNKPIIQILKYSYCCDALYTVIPDDDVTVRCIHN